ncbi:putative permease [Mycolicibacterium chubuense NBB4]|uniref:Putative permease n=1 Tax=Mycolicibacterium chubuense (strain NBB4) TaxID=710421 RepID=I4BRI9_MYCCN|nr:permease [Mycolicibacterium chubuense]AFM19896.1 putative permease [Mycolicibacterium chubuense NBB4]
MSLHTLAARARLSPGTAAGLLLCAAVFVVGLSWAKWMHYSSKAVDLGQTHRWPGSDILATGGVTAGDPPSWHAAATFFHAYVASIWPALVVALLLSAAVQAFLPPSWPARLLNRRSTLSSALAGGAAGMPSMMCTCCAAPVAATLRRNGVTPPAAVAYWLGNPLLNPAVLVFLLMVAPWQWSVTRLVIGLVTVIGAAAAVGLATRDPLAATPAPRPELVDRPGPGRFRPSPGRFAAALAKLALTLLPEYAILVLVIGAYRGRLLTITEPSHRGLLIVVVVSLVGVLVVLPTAGEIPILLSLAVLGASPGVLGALLITLPAVSLPGAAMVARSFGPKATAITAGVVVAAGLLSAAALSSLSSL